MGRRKFKVGDYCYLKHANYPPAKVIHVERELHASYDSTDTVVYYVRYNSVGLWGGGIKVGRFRALDLECCSVEEYIDYFMNEELNSEES